MFAKLGSDECAELLKLLWDHSFTGYALVGDDGRFVSANPAFCRMLEYTESELKRKTFQEITDPDDVAAEQEMAGLVEKGTYESYDMTKAYYTKTKKHLPVLLRVTAFRINRKFMYFLGEVAPVNRPQDIPQLPDGMRERVRMRRFGRFLREYWKEVSVAMSAVAYITAEILKDLKH